jgi:hypothetical protein
MRRDGSVLIHVLVITAVLGLIGALVMRLRLQAAAETAGAVNRTSQDFADESAVNQVSAAWALQGRTCSSDAALGVVCQAPPGFPSPCDCVCTSPSGAKVSSTRVSVGAACQLSAVP